MSFPKLLLAGTVCGIWFGAASSTLDIFYDTKDSWQKLFKKTLAGALVGFVSAFAVGMAAESDGSPTGVPVHIGPNRLPPLE